MYLDKSQKKDLFCSATVEVRLAREARMEKFHSLAVTVA